jgi:DNA-binding NtrC family response regulator
VLEPAKCTAWARSGRAVNVHVIAATNRDLRADRGGRIRNGLFHRLSVVKCRCRRCAIGAKDIPI